MLKLILWIGVAAFLIAPIVSAQNNGEVGSGADGLTTTCVPTRELSAIAGVITATDLNGCHTLPAIVHRSSLDSNGATNGYATIQGTIAIAGPNIPTGGVATYTYAFVGFAGCNTGSSAQQDDVLAAGSGSSFHYLLDMTADECHGYIVVTITAGAVPVTIAHFYFSVDVRAEQTFDDTLTVTNSGSLDITDRLCAASAIGAACTTPTINTVVSGSLTLAGTLNVVNSGGQNIAITSWPTLNAALSGGVTITDDANGWAITSTNALSGTVNVVNSGGQTVAVSSWPELIAHLDGELDIHQDQACGATVVCHTDAQLNGNVTSNTTADISGAVRSWFPMLIGLGILGINAVRREETHVEVGQ